MIGFFDSGLGGLSIVKEVEKLLPDYDYMYLADNARTPYGSRSSEVIYEFVRQGVEELFSRGAELIVLACNTASAVALRRIQQRLLPATYQHKRVLGIIIPTAEEIIAQTKTGHVGVLATRATVESFAFPREITKLDESIAVHQHPAPLLVPMIEEDEMEWDGFEGAIKKYSRALLEQEKRIDTVVLGCTHYALVHDRFRAAIPAHINVIGQGEMVADKLRDYLERHPEMEKRLAKNGKRTFLTTENSPRIRGLYKLFYGASVNPEKINLS